MSRRVPPNQRAEFAQQLEAQCFVHGLDHAAIGPATPADPEGYAAIPEILAAAESVFTSAIFADPESGLSLSAAQACADAVCRSMEIHPDGLANLRFAALANVPGGAPFFPSAYHRGGRPALAIASEATDLATDALREVSSAATARRRLISMIEAHAAALTRLVQPIASEGEIRFDGIDFSLAPYPEQLRSVGNALETLGVPKVGLAGSVAAAAFLADCIDQAQFERTGFCGLFLPVLEDTMLAARAAEELLTVAHLLLYAAVSGAGLEVIPLPGDASAGALSAILIDVGALALRLDRPLTARLLPIPGKDAGDEVRIDSPHLTSGYVMALPAEPLSGLLAGAGVLDIRPHNR